MNGLYVYSITVAGSFLTLVVTTGLTTGLYSPIQSSVLLAPETRNSAPTATPSDSRVFSEKPFDTPQHSGQQPPQPALPYAALESDVLDNEPKITSGSQLGLYPWTAVYDIS